MQNIFKFDRKFRKYTKPGEPNENPRNKSNPILPGLACWDAPLEYSNPESLAPYECSFRNEENTEWIIKKDLRGVVYFLKDGGRQQFIRDVGEEVPNTGIQEAPPADYLEPKYQGNQWIDEAQTLEEFIDENDIVSADAIKVLFEIIKYNDPLPDNFNAFEQLVREATKVKNSDNLNKKVKRNK